MANEKFRQLAQQGIFYQPLGGEQKPADEDGDFMRGVKKSMYQIPQTVGGAVALAGDLVGSEGMRDYGMGVYQKNDDKIQAITKPSDSLSTVLEGDGNAVDWLQNAAGYTAGQAATALATGGVGGFIGKQLALRGIKSVAERAIESAAARQVANKVASQGIKYGAGAALGANNLVQEAGSIYPEAVRQAQEEGRELDAGDKARIVGSSLAAAAVDTGMDALMAGRVLNGSRRALTDQAGNIVRNEAGQAVMEGFGKAARREIGGAMAREGVTEGIQTGIERYGAGQDLSTADAIRDYVDSIGVGAVGGGQGGAIAALHSQKVPDAGPLSRAANAGIDNQILQLQYDPQPLISFPDGSVGHKQDLEAYLTQFPEGEERTRKRREVMGRDPETGKRIKPEPAPEPLMANSPEAEKRMLGAWADSHEPESLDYVQALLSSPAVEQFKDKKLMIVPHPSGSGYTVVPAAWLTPDTQAKSMLLQKKGDKAMLPAPDREAPGGAIRVDSSGEAAPETYADQARTAQLARDEAEADALIAARERDLGKSVPHGPKPAAAAKGPIPTLNDVILNPKGEPFKSEFAAKRKLATDGLTETHVIQPAEGGFVLAPKAEQNQDDADIPTLTDKLDNGAADIPVLTDKLNDGAADIPVLNDRLDNGDPTIPTLTDNIDNGDPSAPVLTDIIKPEPKGGKDAVQANPKVGSGKQSTGVANAEPGAAVAAGEPGIAGAVPDVDAAAGAPALSEQAAGDPNALVAVKDLRGVTHYVRQRELTNENRTLLKRFHKNGQPISEEGKTALHRGNIDADGSKARDAWSSLPFITAKGDKPFTSEASARAGVKRYGQDPEEFAYEENNGGIVAVRKKLLQQEKEAAQPFAPESGTLGIPREEMPQVRTEAHGGLVRHLNAQGIEHETKMVSPDDLKPTQAEFIPERVEAAKEATGDRAVIVANDGHIIDGHHQVLAAQEQGKDVKAIVLDAPIDQALEAVRNSPSAATPSVGESGATVAESGAAPAEQPPMPGSDGRIFGMTPETLGFKQGGGMDTGGAWFDPAAKAKRDKDEADDRRKLVEKQKAENAAILEKAISEPRIKALHDAGLPSTQVLQASRELREGDDSLMRDLARIHGINLPAATSEAETLKFRDVQYRRKTDGWEVSRDGERWGEVRSKLAREALERGEDPNPSDARVAVPAPAPSEPAAPAKPKALQERARKVAERIAIKDVDSTAQGMLHTAREHKASAWKRVKELRAQIKDNPLGNSHLRLDLLKAEDRHREYQQMERDALRKIEEDAQAQGRTTAKPLDHGELNIPGRLNGINAELDKYKASKAAEAKTATKTKAAQTRADKTRARELHAEHAEAMLDKYGPKFDRKELAKEFDSMVKWEPAKFIKLAEKFASEQADGDLRASTYYADKTVEVDGERKPIVDSRGDLIAPDFAGQLAFWKNFDGKVDEKGRPILDDDTRATMGINGSKMDEAVAGMVREGSSTDDILSHIADKSKNADFRALAAALRAQNLKTGIIYGRPSGSYYSGVDAEYATASYRPSTDTAYLHQTQGAEQNLLHELTHAATVRALERGGLASTQIKALHAHVKAMPKFSAEYGITDPEEFVAEAFTSPRFRQMLADTPAPGVKLSLWQKLVGIVRILLGKGAVTDSVLERVMQATPGLMAENRGEAAPAAEAKPDSMRAMVSTATEAFRRWFGDSKVVDKQGKPLVVYHGTTTELEGGAFRPGEKSWNDGIFFTGSPQIASLVYANGEGEIDLSTARKQLHKMGFDKVDPSSEEFDAAEALAEKIREKDRSFQWSPEDLGSWLPKNQQKTLADQILSYAENEHTSGNSSIADAIGRELGVRIRGAAEGGNVIPVFLKMGNPKIVDGSRFSFDDNVQDKWIADARAAGNDGLIINNYDDGGTGGIDNYNSAGRHTVYIVFDPAQAKSATGNNGNFDPSNPDLRASTATADSVTSFIGRLGINRTLSQRVGDLFSGEKTLNGWWHKTVGTQYHKAQVDKDFGRVYNAVQTYLSSVSALANESADLAPTMLPKLDGLSDLKKAPPKKADVQAAATAIFQGTLVDEQVYSDAELQSKFALTAPQIKLYREFRAATDKSLDDMGKTDLIRTAGKQYAGMRDAALGARDVGRAAEMLAAEAEARGDEALAGSLREKGARYAELKENGYAPLMRFGEHTVYVTDANGEQLYFGLYESAPDAAKAARDMRDIYPGATVTKGIMSTEGSRLFAGISPDTIELFSKVAGIDQDPLFQDYLKLVVNNRSALKRLIHRKGIAGYSEDATRVLASFLTSNARAAAKNLHGGEMNEAAEAIPKNKGDVRDEAIKLVDYIQNPVDEASKVRGLLFANFIGGSIASAMVNMTQPVMMTLPYLSQYGGAGKAVKNLTAAMAQAVRPDSSIQDEELRTALQVAEHQGVVSPQEIHNLQAEASRSSTGLSIAGKEIIPPFAARKLALVWGGFFGLAEQFNRKATFIAAYQTARDMTGEQLARAGVSTPYEFAAKAIAETQGVYNRGNRANWGRGAVGATLMTFKQYSTSYLEFLKRLPPQQRAMALAIMVVAAGANGLPFADDLDDLIDTIAQALGYNWSAKKARDRFLVNTLGHGAADFIQHGISGISGIPLDVSMRMGMQNLLPATGIFLKQNTDKSAQVAEIGGAAGALAQRVFKAGDLALHGEVGAAAGALSPTAIANLAKGIDIMQTGQYRDGRGRNVMAADTTDALVKAVGFQPRAVARQQEKLGDIRDEIAVANAAKTEFADDWAQGMYDKNPEAVAKARARIAEWNQKNPETPISITAAQIAKRLRAMRTEKAERVVKSAPKAARAGLRRELED